MTQRRRSDEEKTKPCGLVGWCPLVDESRLFVEAQEQLMLAGVSRDDSFKIAAIAVKKWCKSLAARDIPPDLQVCREVMRQAAIKYRAGKPDRRQIDFIISLLQAIRETQAEHADLKSLVRGLDRVLASF